jgi:hypothetical protein
MKLEDMSKKELDEYGETLGLKLDRRKKKQYLIDAIEKEILTRQHDDNMLSDYAANVRQSEFIIETIVYGILIIGVIGVISTSI